MSEETGADGVPSEQRRLPPSGDEAWPPPSQPPVGYPGPPQPAGDHPAGPFRDDPGHGFAHPGAPPPHPPPPGGQYAGGQYAGGQYPGGQYPAGQYPAGQYPGSQYPGSQQYPAGQYPGSQYPGGQYSGPPPTTPPPPGGPYSGGPYPTGGPYAGQHPGGGYPTGPVPVGYYPPPPGPGGPPDYLGPGYGAPPVPPRRRRPRRMLWLATAATTVLVLGAGGVTAYTLLAGSGVALDTQVPADAVAFAEINLDPPAGQKVAALRFFRHLPDLKTRADAPDLIEGLIEPLFESPEDRRKFVENVKPWLGEHAAVAADPQGARTEAVVLVESTDAGKARAGLDALAREEKAPYGYVIVGRTVVLARTQAVARAAADDANRGSLHGNDTFRRDLGLVDDGGVLTAWVDLARADDLPTGGSGGLGTPSTEVPKADLHGRVVAGLRFTDTTADVTIEAVGLGRTGVGTEAVGPRLRTLPEDTALAVAFSGADSAVRQAYDAATKAGFDEPLRSLEERTRLVLPDDVAALVGSSTVVAVGGTEGKVDYGLISRTDDVDKARSAAERLLTELGEDRTIAVRPVPNGTVLASSPDYADRLAAPGTLGDSELFRATLPDLDRAQVALYADTRRLTELTGSSRSGPTDSIRSFGFTAGSRADTATVHLRMVVG